MQELRHRLSDEERELAVFQQKLKELELDKKSTHMAIQQQSEMYRLKLTNFEKQSLSKTQQLELNRKQNADT